MLTTSRGVPVPALRRLREGLGLSQIELANQAAVCRQTIWKAETGQQSMQYPVACRVADVLGVPLESLQKTT